MDNFLKFVPQKKTGIKLLSDKQMKINFSSYESLMKKINTYRNTLSTVSLDEMLKIDDQFALMYDMVFSIFGKRGSGKTSVVFTLKQEIKKENPGDIVLPMIMPELVPEGQHILSWILENLDSTISEIEEKIKSDSNLIYDTEYFTNCRFRTLNPIRKQYEKVRRDCYLLMENKYFESTFASNINNQIKRGKYSSGLSKELSEFWNILIKAQKKIYKVGEPLIYIIFDDVDLAPDRILEIFNTIIKYLSFPNIIVIITAEEKLLYQVMEKYLNKLIFKEEHEDINCLMAERDGDEENYLKKLALAYINKVLPPSNQYYIDSYNSCRRKMNFILINEAENDKYKAKNVKELLIQIINEYIESRNSDVNLNKENFLLWENNDFISIYLKFWGKTSRQIASQYFIVEELIRQLIKLSEQKINGEILEEEIYRCVYHFMYRTLLSKGLFNSDKKKMEFFLDRIWKYKYDECELFINYPYIREIFEQEYEFSEIGIEDILDVLIMFYFIENLLMIWNKGSNPIDPYRDKVNGERTLIYILDELTPGNYSLIKKSEKGINEILYYYEKLLEDVSRLINFNIFSNIQVKDFTQMALGKYREFFEDQSEIEKIINKLYNWSTRSPKWFKTIIKLLYFRYENIFEINDEVIKVISLEQKNLGEDVYTHNKILELENEVIENLSNLYTGKDTETQCSENLNLITKIEFDEAIDNLEQLENKILDRCKGNIFGICKTFLKEEGYEDLVQEIENIIQIDANESNHLIEENNNLIYHIVAAIYEILLSQFKYYYLNKDEDEFISELEKNVEGINNEELSFWCVKLKNEIELDKKVEIITLQNLIAKIKWYREKETGKKDVEQMVNIDKLYRLLKNNFYIKVKKPNFLEAKKYICLFQVLKQVIRNFLKKYSQWMDNANNSDDGNNPYMRLYIKIKEILNSDSKSSGDIKQKYISNVIKNNINEVTLDYVHYVKRRIEGNNIYE